MFRRRKRPEPSPDNAYVALRELALDAVAAGVEPRAEHPDVVGVVVDIPAEGGHATVVAMADDTTSMYTSGGGGTIGAGEHPSVAAATRALLGVVQERLAELGPVTDDGELPPAGTVRFHVLTPLGRRRADVPEAAFWGEPHPLTAVIAAVQHVLTAMREATESGR